MGPLDGSNLTHRNSLLNLAQVEASKRKWQVTEILRIPKFGLRIRLIDLDKKMAEKFFWQDFTGCPDRNESFQTLILKLIKTGLIEGAKKLLAIFWNLNRFKWKLSIFQIPLNCSIRKFVNGLQSSQREPWTDHWPVAQRNTECVQRTRIALMKFSEIGSRRKLKSVFKWLRDFQSADYNYN